jgi:hypothetical protein
LFQTFLIARPNYTQDILISYKVRKVNYWQLSNNHQPTVMIKGRGHLQIKQRFAEKFLWL